MLGIEWRACVLNEVSLSCGAIGILLSGCREVKFSSAGIDSDEQCAGCRVRNTSEELLRHRSQRQAAPVRLISALRDTKWWREVSQLTVDLAGERVGARSYRWCVFAPASPRFTIGKMRVRQGGGPAAGVAGTTSRGQLGGRLLPRVGTASRAELSHVVPAGGAERAFYGVSPPRRYQIAC